MCRPAPSTASRTRPTRPSISSSSAPGKGHRPSASTARLEKSDMVDPVRIGCLGAARIAPAALVRPAKASGVATVTAIAARDRAKADAFARTHDVPRVYDSYEALIADDD